MFEVASTSLLGNRKINQDRCSVLSDEHSILLLLSDGLGGHPKGEVAAQILMDTGRVAFASISKPIHNPNEFLHHILQSAHDAILAFGNKQRPLISPRATAVIALIQDGQLFWRHLGDSRLYLFRNHRVVMRTRDHSVLEAMRNADNAPLDANAMRYRNLVTHCLGGTGRAFSKRMNNPVPLRPLDIVLLCTDGLWSPFSDDVLGAKMRNQGSLERMASDITREAEQLTVPRSDNITLVILRWLSDAEGNAPAQNQVSPPAIKPTPNETNSSELDEAILTLRTVIDEFSSQKHG